jgi:DNA-binding transcriptional LysR family regulator
MDSSLLKTFLVLAKTKNFTVAASKLYRSQSAISLQVLRLESLLGKTLFIRDNRNVSLTHEGEQLVGYAQSILKLEEQMLYHFQQAHQLAGEVKFGTPEDIATVYLPTILANFNQSHPNVELNVNCDLTKRLINDFESGVYDIILIKQDPASPHPNSEVVWNESLVWVCGEGFWSRFSDDNDILPLVLSPSPCVYRQRAIDALNSIGRPWRIVYSSPSVAGTIAAVKAGLGVSVMPEKMVPKHLWIIDDLPELTDAQIALLKKEELKEAAKVFSTYVSDHIILDTQQKPISTL